MHLNLEYCFCAKIACFTIVACGGYDDNKNKTPLINYDAHDGVIGALQSSCSEKSYKIQSNTSAMVRFLI